MVRSATRLSVTLGLVLAFLLVVAAPSPAHTIKDVGAYRFTVGWSTEPAYMGQMNSVQLVLATLKDGKPYTALTDTLKVTVTYAQQSVTYGLIPTFDPDTGFGTPGDYRAWFFPTAPGAYTFRFVGTIGSQKVDESFTSGPQTFASVQDPASAQFPMKAPTNVELAARINADSARTATDATVSSARTVGYVGIAVGAVGVVLAAAALFMRRRA